MFEDLDLTDLFVTKEDIENKLNLVEEKLSIEFNIDKDNIRNFIFEKAKKHDYIHADDDNGLMDQWVDLYGQLLLYE